MTPFPTQQPDQRATNMLTPNPSATEGGRAVSGDLSGPSALAMVRALAALLEPEAFDPDIAASPEWREPTQACALNHAAKVITSGYRLVSEDDTTVEIRALTKTLEASRDHARRARREGLDDETCRFWSGVSGFLRSRIRALEAGEEPDWPDAANSTRTELGEDDDPARAAVRALREAGE